MQPETIDDILDLLKERPLDAELYQLLGQLYLRDNQLAEAHDALKGSLALDPDDPWTHLYLGHWCLRSDRLREALGCFKHAAELLPDKAIAYTCQGDVYRAQGRYDQAEAAYRLAAHVTPHDEQAARTLSEWNETRRSGRMVVTRAMILDASRNDYAATCILLAPLWLRDHPDDLGILLAYAEMLFQITRFDEAIRVFESALGRNEESQARWAIFNRLGELHRYRGDFAEAERWFHLAIETKSDDAGSYIFLGAAQARQGKLRDAEDTHRAATRCSDGMIDEAYHNLGLVLRGQGRIAEAADCFRKAIAIDPEYKDAIEAIEDVEMALAFTASYIEDVETAEEPPNE